MERTVRIGRTGEDGAETKGLVLVVGEERGEGKRRKGRRTSSSGSIEREKERERERERKAGERRGWRKFVR